jgi:hypothetical protein
VPDTLAREVCVGDFWVMDGGERWRSGENADSAKEIPREARHWCATAAPRLVRIQLSRRTKGGRGWNLKK